MSLLMPVIRQNSDDIGSGDYLGILFRIIEKGTQEELFRQNNQVYKRPKILFTWVLPEHFQLIQQQPKPILIHKEYTQSLRQGSLLYRDVIAMRGCDFSESELTYPFDLLSLLGIPCLLSIKVTRKGDASYYELTKVQPATDQLDIPESPYELYSLTFGNWNWQYFDELSLKLQNEIKRSPEFLTLPERPGPTQQEEL